MARVRRVGIEGGSRLRRRPRSPSAGARDRRFCHRPAPGSATGSRDVAWAERMALSLPERLFGAGSRFTLVSG